MSVSSENPPNAMWLHVTDGGREVGVLLLGDDWHYYVPFA